jgi:hypothetical protein
VNLDQDLLFVLSHIAEDDRQAPLYPTIGLDGSLVKFCQES